MAVLFRSHQLGTDFDEIRLQLPTLMPAGLHAALLYYLDHADEIETILAASQKPPPGAVHWQT